MAKSRYLAAALFATLALSCSKEGADKNPMTPANEETDAEAKECQSNLDCSQGYTCAFDHARSHVVRYCTPE
jgi:hypothetical protein